MSSRLPRPPVSTSPSPRRAIRVCDACSIRRVKCDGRDPCERCTTTGLECRRLRTRKKMGPKSFHAKTMSRLASVGLRAKTSPHEQTEEFESAESTGNPSLEASELSPLPFSVSPDTLRPYLEIYQKKMYQVWPVCDVFSLLERLQATSSDSGANMVALSACTATILQLQLIVDEGIGMPTPHACIDKIEDMRTTTQYRRWPSLDSLLTSFFMHVSYLHLGQQSISTLLLREAITIAHLLGLHQPAHYTDMDSETAQTHLRILWLLFVTERAHARQYDVPCTLVIPPVLPQLHPEEASPTFTSLCNMFACLDSASNPHELASAEQRLQLIPATAASRNSIQQADLSVTQQWMRLLLWKSIVASQATTMTVEATGTLESIVFPVQVARDLLANIAFLSADALEAHGPGMGFKLFSLAAALADVVTCMPTHAAVSSSWGAVDCLAQLSDRLQSLRGGASEAVTVILRDRLVEIGLDHMLPTSRVVELNSPVSDESEVSETGVSPAATVTTITEFG